MSDYILRLEDCRLTDLARVGSRNASLGELAAHLSPIGITVPRGFTTTASAYREFMNLDGLGETIRSLLHGIDVENFQLLAHRSAEIRQAIMDTALPGRLHQAISSAWHELSGGREMAVAARASISYGEGLDSPFAGQQLTLLNISDIGQLISGVHELYASVYSDRAIAHRAHLGIDADDVAVSAAIHRMVGSERGSAGIMFTLDTESGFRDVVLITSTYGFAESVVQGAVNPDEFYVHKPMLEAGRNAILRRNLGMKTTKLVAGFVPGSRVRYVEVPVAEQRRFSIGDEDVLALARQAVAIEKLFDRPMGIEWAKSADGRLYVLHAMPETVQSRHEQGTVQLLLKQRGPVLASGRSVGRRIGSGKARVVIDAREMYRIRPGDVLVTDATDADWEPALKHLSAVVTNRGGRTSHAAIAARELGIAAVVGCGNATESIRNGMDVTVSCAEGEQGFVYEGLLDYQLQAFRVAMMPKVPVQLMMNVSNPDRAFSLAATPNFGVGLVRIESIVNRMIGIHPLAAIEHARQTEEVRKQIDDQIAGYPDAVSFYVQKLAEGIACIAAAVAPNPVYARLSDFKTSDYAALIGGEAYEDTEQNPMLGFRGAARYLDPQFRPGFELECRAVRHVRETMGLTNVHIIVPFVRTVDEAARVVHALAQSGLKRGGNGLKLMMMCETPSNALLVDQFLAHFDGMTIGSNDLTQLTLGIDRNSERLADLFEEHGPALRKLIEDVIEACKRAGKHSGICGEAPSDDLSLVRWLVEQGIESISLNPDAIIPTWQYLAEQTSQSR